MSCYSPITMKSAVLIACFLCALTGNLSSVSAYSQQRQPSRSRLSAADAPLELAGRREFFGGIAGIASLTMFSQNANAVISSKYCAYGEGNDCEDLAEGNPYILELQRKSAANKQANIDSAKNAFYAKNYPDWFAAVGKTMVQKESDGTFIVIDNAELRKLSDAGKIAFTTPTAMGGKVKDVTQKPMLVLKE